MSKKFAPFLIIAALVLIAAVLVQPDNALASQLLGITITPTSTQPPPADTPTPTAEETQPPEDTPTPTSVTQPPKKTAKPKATELVLLPATGEFPIDPQQGLQWFFVIGLVILIGAIFFRAVKGSKLQE